MATPYKTVSENQLRLLQPLSEHTPQVYSCNMSIAGKTKSKALYSTPLKIVRKCYKSNWITRVYWKLTIVLEA